MGIVTNNYAYHINKEIFDLVTDKQIAYVGKNLGKAIQPAYEDEESITPHKWMKSGLLGLAAASAVINALGGIAMGIIAVASSTMTPLLNKEKRCEKFQNRHLNKSSIPMT